MATDIKKLLNEYWELRAERLALQKEVDDLKAEEDDIFAQIRVEINAPLGEVVKADGCQAMLKPVRTPVVTDWPKLYKYIAETDGFDMLQKRLTPTAVKERWENLVDVPGVMAEDTVELSITKLK